MGFQGLLCPNIQTIESKHFSFIQIRTNAGYRTEQVYIKDNDSNYNRANQPCRLPHLQNHKNLTLAAAAGSCIGLSTAVR